MDFASDIAVQLQQMVAHYWHELDRNDARDITRFYAEDCTLLAGPDNAYDGHAGIRAFYDARAKLVAQEKDGTRTTRHLFSNFRVEVADADHATVDFVTVHYSGSGRHPIMEFAGPSMVSDVRLQCRRGPAGKWLIVRFRGEPIFIGGEAFTAKVLNRKRDA